MDVDAACRMARGAAEAAGVPVNVSVVRDYTLVRARGADVDLYTKHTRAVYTTSWSPRAVLWVAAADAAEAPGVAAQIAHAARATPADVLGVVIDPAAPARPERGAALGMFLLAPPVLRATGLLARGALRSEQLALEAIIDAPARFAAAALAAVAALAAARDAHTALSARSLAFGGGSAPLHPPVCAVLDWDACVVAPTEEQMREDVRGLGLALAALWARRMDVDVGDFRGTGLAPAIAAALDSRGEYYTPVKIVIYALVDGRHATAAAAARAIRAALVHPLWSGSVRPALPPPDRIHHESAPRPSPHSSPGPSRGGGGGRSPPQGLEARCAATETTAAVVVVKGRVVFEYGSGGANARVFSMTKSVMGTMAAYYLVTRSEEDAMSMFGPVADLMYGADFLMEEDALSALRDKIAGVSMNELLTQTSNIMSKEYAADDFLAMMVSPNLDFETYVNERIFGIRRQQHHERVFHYDNITTQLAGMLFEQYMRRRGQPRYLLKDDVRARFLRGTDATWFADDGTDTHRYTAAYTGLQADRDTLLQLARTLMETPEYRRVLDFIEAWPYASDVPYAHRPNWRYSFCWWLPGRGAGRRRVMVMIGFLGQYLVLDLDNDIIAIRQHAIGVSDLKSQADRFPTFVEEALAFADTYIAAEQKRELK